MKTGVGLVPRRLRCLKHTDPLLIAGACASESIEDVVCEKIEVEQLRSLLPRMLAVLSEKNVR